MSEAERAQLQAAAAMVGDLITAQGLAQTTTETRMAALARATDAMASLPRLSADERTVPCPHCGLVVVIRGQTLAKPTAADDHDERERRKTMLDAAQKDVDRAATALREARDAKAEKDLNLKRAQAAAEKLKTLPLAKGGADLEQAREQATLAERRQTAFRSKRDADRIHANILINLQIQAMLAPDGLRLTTLRAAVAAFNVDLRDCSNSAGWFPVFIDGDTSILYGGQPWVLCSESEQFRARVVLQVAMAARDKSAALVIDGADILDAAGRNGLIRMLRGQRALVCMTLPAEKVPRLGALGVSYWLEAGVAQRQGVEAAV